MIHSYKGPIVLRNVRVVVCFSKIWDLNAKGRFGNDFQLLLLSIPI